MYRGNSEKSSLQYWFEFAINKELEELFMKIYPMIEDRIRELFPQLLKEYQNEIKQNVSVDIETSLNGKKNDFTNLRGDIEKFINDELRRKL